MSESERAQALKSIQLEMFQDYLLKRRELKRQLILVHGKGLKRCRKCGHEMDVEQFYKDSRYADGYYSYCRECQLAKITRKGNVRAGVAA
jgi:formamidopyrimidine-DNA glycosylase